MIWSIIIPSQLHLISPRIHSVAKIRNAYCHFLAASFVVLHSEWWQYWRWLMSFPIFSLCILCRKFSPDISPKILVSFDKNLSPYLLQKNIVLRKIYSFQNFWNQNLFLFTSYRLQNFLPILQKMSPANQEYFNFLVWVFKHDQSHNYVHVLKQYFVLSNCFHLENRHNLGWLELWKQLFLTWFSCIKDTLHCVYCCIALHCISWKQLFYSYSRCI